MDHGSHTLYLAFDWLGAYPTAVTAKATTLGEFDTEDNFSCALTFPGATATAHLSWTAGVRKVIYTIHAEHGAIRVEDDDVEVAVKVTQNAKAAWEVQRERIASDWMDASHVGWFRVLFQQFASAIANHDFVGRDTVAGLRTVEVIEAAYASAIDRSRERSLHDEP
jgi:predicted dehydrogenase